MEHFKTPTTPSLLGHLLLAALAIIVLIGLYHVFQNIISITLGSLLFIALHIAIASGLLYLLGCGVIKLFKHLTGS